MSTQLVFPQFPQPDFIGAMQAAQQYRMNEAQLARLNEEAMRRQQAEAQRPELLRLQAMALQGDPQAMRALQSRAPEVAMKVQEFSTEQAGRENDALEKKRVSALRMYDRQLALLQRAKASPSMLPSTIKYMVDAKLLPPEAAQSLPNDAELDAVINDIRIHKTMMEGPEAHEKLSEFEQLIKARESETPFRAGEKTQLRDERLQSMAKKGGGGGDIYIGNDRGGATTAVQTNIGNDIRGYMESLATLGKLDKDFDESFVTGVGTVRRKLTGWLDTLTGISIDEKFRVQARQWFNEREQFFNAYRKLITGAGASATELAQLQDSILSTTTPPSEVRAAIRQLNAKIERDMGIAQDIMRSGVPLNKSAFDAEYGRRYVEGVKAESQNSQDKKLLQLKTDYNAYHGQLMREGKTKEEAFQAADEKFGLVGK